MTFNTSRFTTALVGLGVAGLALSACGSTSSSGGGALSKLGKGEGTVNLIAWAGYVENGGTDPKVDWVTGFEKETGCKVNVKIGGTSDEMVQLMKTGEYDAVSASGDATLRLIAGKDVAPVNTSLIPNYKDVYEGLKNQKWNSSGGKAYGVPHGRGANPRTRARSPRMTRRSTSPMPPCTSWRPSPILASRTPTRSTTSSSRQRSTC
jgi:putative spermidine/putrescine transport system substrate-binding protein